MSNSTSTETDRELAGLRRYPFARRGFVTSGLISGFTLATARVEAQAIHTDAVGLEAGEVRISVRDGALPAYAARPAGSGRFPARARQGALFALAPSPGAL